MGTFRDCRMTAIHRHLRPRQGAGAEDMEFAWEHPTVLDAMEMVLAMSWAEAAIGTIRLKGVAPGTMLLEHSTPLTYVAPRALQVERFAPCHHAPAGWTRAAGSGQLLPHLRLNELVQNVKRPLPWPSSNRCTRTWRPKCTLASALPLPPGGGHRQRSEQRMRAELGAELERLQASASGECGDQGGGNHLPRRPHRRVRRTHQHASLQLQALRPIITT